MPCRRRGWPRRRGAGGAPGRPGRATDGWPAPTSGRRVAGAPRWLVSRAASSSSWATDSSGPTAARARCHARAGEPFGQRAGERPVGAAAIGTRRVVVGGRAHQRVAERQPIAVEHRRRRSPRPPPARRRRGRAPAARSGRARGRRPARQPPRAGRRARAGVEALEQEVDDALARRPDRQRVGQLGRARPAGRRRAGWPPRPAPTGCPRRRRSARGARSPALTPASRRIASATSSATTSRSMTGPVSVWLSAPARRVDTMTSRSNCRRRGDVRQRPPCRHVDPLEVVDDDDDRGGLGGVDEQVARGEGDGERLDGLVGALDGERRPHRRRSRRCQTLEPSRTPSSSSARPDHASSTSASTPSMRTIRQSGWSTAMIAAASSTTAVLPIPASPTMVRAPPSPTAAPAAKPAMASTTS